MKNKTNSNQWLIDAFSAAVNYTELPSGICFDTKDDGANIQIRLSARAAAVKGKNNYSNMQNDDAAFEGWALACHCYVPGNTKILLDVNGEIPDWDNVFMKNGNFEIGHYGRFLYRVLTFYKQFGLDEDWFELSEDLKRAVKEFEGFLQNGSFFNNYPSAEGKAEDDGDPEHRVELFFEKEPQKFFEIAERQIPEITGKIHRQLPCGLFCEEVHTSHTVFAGNKGAMDFWNLSSINDESVMTVVELKTLNKMIGEITEAWFYGHYCYDVYCRNGLFNKNLGKNKSFRGYEELKNNEIDKINMVMFSDEGNVHPLMADKRIVEMMNKRSAGITYFLMTYKYKDGAVI